MSAATILRIEVTTESGKKILDLARHSLYEHWIIAAWDETTTGRVPRILVRLEGLPFVPSGLNGANYTVTAQLPDALLDSSNHYFNGQLIAVIDGRSPRALRLRIPTRSDETAGIEIVRQKAEFKEEDQMRKLRRPRAEAALWPAAQCVLSD